jgi:hypothetical protein
MLECPHEDLARIRRGLTASAPIMLLQLVSRIEAAYVRADRPLPDGVAAKRASDLRALSDAAAVWSTADGKHVLYHMLAALPWPARVAAGGGAPLSALLGRIFDETVLERRYRRRLADGVIRWASHWIRTFAAERWRLLAQARALNALASP